MSDIIEIASKERPDFKILSGDDALTLPLMTLGGHGVISVAANLVPHDVKALTTALEMGDVALARKLHFKLAPLCRALFLETNPIPIKAAMHLSGLPAGECRLPLYRLSPDHMETLQEYLIHKNEALNTRES
jgi:4-hydroxy-tetrahydrodipicolinate synthase